MSSTSSSECECTGPPSFLFNTAVPNFLENPFCPTVRQPLIYYAKIPEPYNWRPKRENKKDDSNCFIKAFRWYTQEHGSSQRKNYTTGQVDYSDFAAWLDKKYSEYVYENEANQSRHTQNQSSTCTPKTPKKTKSSRKFGRMRSPWRRRKPTSKEKGDVPIKLDQSFQYILQPQDMHAPSECGRRTSRRQSTTTIISMESSAHRAKMKVKSKSLLSIYHAKGFRDKKREKSKSSGKNVTCECIKKNAETQYETFSLETLKPRQGMFTSPPVKERSPVEDNKNDILTNKYFPEKKHQANVQCQCSETNLFDNDLNEKFYMLGNEKLKQKQDRNINDDAAKEFSANQMNNSTCPKPTVMFYDHKKKNETEKLNTSSAQTSDHSITLTSVTYEHPIFLKIVRAYD